MKIIDFKNKRKPIQFDRETIMIMCYTPKIIVFETSEELTKFKRVWEEVIVDYYDRYEKEIDKDFEKQHIARWYVDQFEEESWMINDEDHEGRKLKVVPLTKKQAREAHWDNTICTYFGVLDSKDTYADMYTLEKQCEMIELMFETEELNKRLKEDTKEMFKQILEVWEEDISSFYCDDDYFTVKVEEI